MTDGLEIEVVMKSDKVKLIVKVQGHKQDFVEYMHCNVDISDRAYLKNLDLGMSYVMEMLKRQIEFGLPTRMQFKGENKVHETFGFDMFDNIVFPSKEEVCDE